MMKNEGLAGKQRPDSRKWKMAFNIAITVFCRGHILNQIWPGLTELARNLKIKGVAQFIRLRGTRIHRDPVLQVTPQFPENSRSWRGYLMEHFSEPYIH